MKAQINDTKTTSYNTQFFCTVTNDKGISREVYVVQDQEGNLESVVWGYNDRPLAGFNNFREAAYAAIRETLAA